MIVDVKELTKRFRRGKRESVTAVDNIGFTITPGERVAFIDPNGAGKSTTLKMLTGILYPSSGSALVSGYVPWAQRKRLALEIGIVFGQRSQLWYHLKVRDSFDVLAKIYAIEPDTYRARAGQIAEVLRITDLIDRPVKSLSLGQRMRCEIAAALLHRPKVLFLDEPTIGLDVTAKALLREHLRHLAEAEDTVILLTSHDTGDIEEICHRVILINHGRILLDKPLGDLRSTFLTTKQVTLVTEEEEPATPMAEGVSVVGRARHRLTLAVDVTKQPVDKVVAAALGQLTVQDLTIENAPLDAVIRDLYGDGP